VVAVRGNASATVSWTAPSNNGSPITAYAVTSDPGGLTCTWTSGPLTCTISGLTNGTAYAFTVTATNDVGTGPASVPSNGVTPATVPGAPTDATAVRGNASADVSWTAPADNGGSVITGYTVTSSPGGLTCTTATTGCTVSGLTNGTAYAFTVTATNGVGTGSASAPSNSVTPATVPGAPTGVVATRGNTQATVSWTAPASGGSSITGYTVSSSPGALTCAWTSGPLTCTISGLTNGTAYTFTVTATNDVGTGASSAASNSVTPATVPDVPTDVVAAGGNASASVNWDVPAFDGGSAITGYTVTSSPGGLTCTAATPTCTVTGLTNGTAYTFTVTATNDVGTGASSAASNSVTPATVPGAPTNVVAVGGNTQASVSWTAPAFDGGSAITGYTVTSSPGGLTCTTAATSCTVTGLTNGTAYTFTVTATNDVGTGAASAPSNSVTPATVPGATANVVAVRGNASAIVFWTPPVDVGGSPITSYTVSGSPDGTCTTSLSFCVVTGLTNGVGYTFTVSATNAAGTGPASEPSSQVTPATVPGAPTDVVATRGNTQATISWTAPADNGGAAIFLYTVSASGGLTCMTAATYCTVPGLTNGAAYTFTVTATNVVGTGAPSAASNSVTPATVPGAPTSVTAARGNASADVSWTAPASDGGSAITGYTVTSNPGGLTCTTATTSCTVPGLTNGTAYTFTVTATNEVGTGPASAASNSVTPAIVPGAPTGATAVRGNTQASISWTAPASNGGSVITGYTVTSTPGSFTCTSTGALTCTVTGLTNGTAYTFTVTATNVVGTGAPSAASNSVTPATVPGAPTGAVATRGNASASLSWTAPADNGGSAITGYTVTSNPDGSTCTTTASSNCTVTGLTNGTAYTFTVTATNDVGTGAASAASNSVTPATVPGAPTGVSGLRGDAQVTVSWTAPASNGGSAITGYTVTSSPGSFTCTTTGALTCTVTGLTNGSSYTFTVTATNDVGTGAASAPSSPVTLGTAPGAPTGVAAVAGNASATVSWTAPASDGGLAITGYTVTSSPGGFTCTTATTSCTVTSLTNGTWYTFTVRATNATGTGPASASSTPVIPQPPMTRYSGSDKYATAAAVSANTFPAHCGCTAYIAYADNFPDALAGAAAAGTVKGPVLFVAASGAINSSTATELTRLAPDRIVVLGSNMAISDAVFNVLKAYAPTGQTFRYSGSNRFATAAAVSANTFSADCHCTAYVAYAMNFPDALAAAAAAGMVPGPVLLVATTGAINTATATELTRLHPDHIVVVGSPSVVSAAVFNALKAYAPTGQTFRYYGTSRYATAASISSHTFAADCGCVVYVSAGTDFNGALSAAAAAGTLKGPLLIVGATGALDTSVAAELTRLQPVRIVVVGNTSTVSPAVYNLLAAYAPTS
jgi:putative cell wall-binding protein